MSEFSFLHQLPRRHQAELLARKGIFLAKRYHGESEVKLYAIEDYFVEVWARQGIEVISTFQKMTPPLAILESYVNDLDVPSFLQ